jgi:hypothetical protein
MAVYGTARVDRLPSDGPHGEPDFFKHVELIDGALVFTSPQKRFHERMSRGLVNSLRHQPTSQRSLRVEENDGKPVGYVYELDPATKAYAITGIHHGELSVSVPFPINVDLEALPC